jgi:hypothetical protein
MKSGSHADIALHRFMPANLIALSLALLFAALLLVQLQPATAAGLQITAGALGAYSAGCPAFSDPPESPDDPILCTVD